MAKLFATINSDGNTVELERSSPHTPWTLAGEGVPELTRTGPGTWSLIRNGRSLNVLVLKEDRENNTLRVRIGAHTYTVALEDEQSRLMRTLGLDKAAGAAVRELKAPMPGLVLKVLVKEGDTVKKNEPLLVLEAMKMENVIKSPADVVVAQVHAQERAAVEKGQLLLSFA